MPEEDFSVDGFFDSLTPSASTQAKVIDDAPTGKVKPVKQPKPDEEFGVDSFFNSLEKSKPNNDHESIAPDLRTATNDIEYVVATPQHVVDWKTRGEIELGEYHDRFHKWLTAVPIISAGVMIEPGLLLTKAYKLESNGYGPDEQGQKEKDIEELKAFQLDLEEMEARGMSWGAEILWGASESVAFGGELMLTAGFATAGKTAAKLTLKEGIAAALKHVLGKTMKTFTTKQGMAIAGKAAARTGAVFAPRLAGDTVSELWEDGRFTLTDKGEFIMNQARKTPGTAFMNASKALAIEGLVELYGGKVLKAGAGKLKSALPKKFIEQFSNLIPENKVAEFTQRLLVGDGTVYDGMIYEIGEESLSGLMAAWTGVDDRDITLFEKSMNAFYLSKGEGGDYSVNPRQLGVTLGILSVVGGVSIGAKKMMTRLKSDGMSDQGVEDLMSLMTENDIEAGNIVAEIEAAEVKLTEAVKVEAVEAEALEARVQDRVDQGETREDAVLLEEAVKHETVASFIESQVKDRTQTVEDLVERGHTPEQAEFIARRSNEMMDQKSPSVADIVNNPAEYTQQPEGERQVWRVVPEGMGVEAGDYVFTSKEAAEEFLGEFGYERGQTQVIEETVSGTDLVEQKGADNGELIYIPESIQSKEKLTAIFNKAKGIKVESGKVVQLKPGKKPTQKAIKEETAKSQDISKVPPSESRVTTTADHAGHFTLPDETKVQAIRRSIEDMNVRLKVLNTRIEAELGETLDENLDLWAQKDMLPRKESDALRRIRDQKREFVRKMHNAGVSLETLDEYLHALHAKERNVKMNEARKEKKLPPVDGLSGMTDAKADKVLGRDNSKMESFAKDVRKMSNALLDFEVEAGLMKPEEADGLKGLYANYVPLFRDLGEDSIGMGSGSGVDVRGKETKKAKGSTKSVISPLGNVFAQMERAQVRALRNQIGNTVIDLVEEHPFLKDIFKIEKQKYMPRYNDKGELQYMDPLFKLGDDVLGTKKDGVQYTITISDRRIAAALKNLNVVRLPKFFQLLRGAIGIWSSFKTRWRPEFIITNFERDLGEALINLNVEKSMLKKEGKGLKRDVVKNLFKSQREIWKYLRGGKDAMADDFFKRGGDSGHFWLQDAMDSQENLQDLERQIENQGIERTLNVVRSASQFIDDVNSMVELGVRYSAYKALVKRGMSKDRAVQSTSDMTVNFMRKGEYSGFLQSFYGFISPAIQGTSKVIRTMGTKQGRGRVLQGTTGLVALGFFIRVASMMMDEEGDEQIGDWAKNHKVTLAIGEGKSVTLWSMPYGYTSFYSMGSNMAEVMFGKKSFGEATSQIIGTTANSFSPFGTDTNALIPTLYKPISEINANKTWYDGPVYKDQVFTNTPKPDAEAHFNSTTETAKFIATLMQNLSGGDAEGGKSGVIDIHPDTLQYVYGQYLGGPFEFVTSSIEAAARGIGGDFNPNLTPFVRQFYREGKPDMWSYGVVFDTLEVAYKTDVSERDKDKFYRAIEVGVEEGVFDRKKGNGFIQDFLKAQYRIGGIRDDETIKQINKMPEEDRVKLIGSYSERTQKTIAKKINELEEEE